MHIRKSASDCDSSFGPCPAAVPKAAWRSPSNRRSSSCRCGPPSGKRHRTRSGKRPASNRNGGRNEIGMTGRLHRNTQRWAGLLRDAHRKTGWMRAEAAGDPGPWSQQAILEGQVGRRRPARHCARICPQDVLPCLTKPVSSITRTASASAKRSRAVVARQVNVDGQNGQLPDRRVRRLCIQARECFRRSRAVSAEGLDGRPCRLAQAPRASASGTLSRKSCPHDGGA